MKYYGICPASCGEFVQGVMDRAEYLCSYAVDLYSTAEVEEKLNNINLGPLKSRKAIEAVRGDRGEIQIELYGDWTYEQAQQWLDAGVSQAIYHQSRDALLAGETWGEKDLNKVKKLIEMGFRVSVTGGLSVDTLELFEGVDVFTFIAGRGITEAEDPAAAARAFKNEIKRIWG